MAKKGRKKSSAGASGVSFEDALRQHQAGRLPQAARMYRELLAHDPKNGAVLQSLSVVLRQMGQGEEGRAMLGQAVALDPGNVPWRYDLAKLDEIQGRPDDALEAYGHLMQLEPANSEFLFHRGRLLRRRGKTLEARTALELAHKLRPDLLEAAEHLALVQEEAGELDQAIETLSNLLLRHPKSVRTLRELARLLSITNRWEEAAHVLEVLKQHMPKDADSYWWLGRVLVRLRQLPAAEKELVEAVRLNPLQADLWLELAEVRERTSKDDEAMDAVRHVVALAPDEMRPAAFIARLLHDSGRMEEMNEILLHGSKAISDSPDAQLLAAMLMPGVTQSVQEIQDLRDNLHETLMRLQKRGEPIADPIQTVPTTNFPLGYQGQNDKDLLEETAKTLLQLSPSLGYVSPALERKPIGGRRLKVGFLSSNLREHVVGRVLNKFMSGLNRDRYEVYLFELQGKYAGGQEIGRAKADHVILVPPEIGMARTAIEAEQPDILITPDFFLVPYHDYLSYSRLAPVQCSTWGHPGSSGRKSIDYWITCEDWDPPGNEKFYTEKLVRFTQPPMIMNQIPAPETILTREQLGLPDGNLYACLQTAYKLHPEYDSMLAEILRRDEKGWIVGVATIKDRWIREFQKRFAKNYPDVADRFFMMKVMPIQNYMSVLAHSAVSIDPIHYGGANTTAEAFTMGCPVVTLPGDQVRGRQTLSFYRLMDNYMELVVGSREEYVEKAVSVAKDRAYRAQVSKEILARNHLIFDTEEVTRQLEAFFEEAALGAIGA